jgi:HEXXH motif-containing protein
MPSHMVEPRHALSGHRVSWELIAQVFAGPVDASAMGALWDGQYSRRLLLLKILRESLSGPAEAGNRRTLDEAWHILVEAEKHAPDVVRQILLYPSVGTWLVRAIRRIRGIVHDDVPIWVDMGYLSSIAVAAAVRAGIDVRTTVPVWHGRINLPTVGQFEVAEDDSTRVVRLRAKDSTVFLESGDEIWNSVAVRSIPLRLHHSTAGGHTIRWTLDDTDPYRKFDSLSPPERLGSADLESWRRKLDRAWEILVEDHGDYVAEMLAADPVIVPMTQGGGFVASSSSASFGAICVAMPETPSAMAETVLHEIQHSKLNALLDLVPLQRPGPDRLCYAPWRRDPRPLGGLLHGIYAFAGVTEYWYRRWSSQPRPGDRTAAFHFVHHQNQVREALRALGSADELTEVGTRLLEVASARLDACDASQVSTDIRELAAALSVESRLAWRMQHLEPAADKVAQLAVQWCAGESFPDRAVQSTLRPFHRSDAGSALVGLLVARALDPDGQTIASEARSAEREFVDHGGAEAMPAFANRVREDPDDDGGWIGLLLSMTVHGGDEPPPPEVVSATYRRIATIGGTPPDPVTLVEWFSHR